MQLRLLGQPSLTLQGKSQPVLGYGALVLAWLALHQRGDILPARVRLARALWPDEGDDQARRRLTNAIYRLKRDFPLLEDHFIGDANSIGLSNLSIDAIAFGRQIQSTDPGQWLAALDLYDGDLLQDADANWLEEWRAELRELYLSGLQKGLAHSEGLKDIQAAIRIGQRWVNTDPLSEEAHTCLIRLYASQNRSAEALAQYQTLEQTLHQELGATPRRETQAFVHSLRPNETITYRSLVGRGKELRALADRLVALQAGHGGVVVLEGEPGVGKTRLLEEIIQLARWHRLAVLRGGASEQHETPYAPLDSAMQSAAELLEVASPLMRETLRPLLEATPEAALNSASSAVSAALERWLLKLSQPLVVVLDDLQWAGDLFWALLPLLSKIARQQKVLLVLAHRSQELQSEPFAVEAMSNLRREGSVLQLELGGLSLEECATLARALGKMLDQSELERLYRLSSGNPLVFGEFLLGSARAEHLEGLLKSRFERLDEQARQALQAASVLGNVFDQAVWAAMLDFVPPTQRLIEARFLYQDEVKLAFQHDLIRSLIYKGQSGEQRQGWHSKAFSILRMQNERVAVLAHHALEAERHEDAIPFLRQAAEEAFGFGSMKEAKKFVTKVFSIKPFNSGEFDENLARTRIVQLKLAAEDRLSSAYFEEVEKLEQLALARGKFDIAFATFSLKLAVYEARGDAEGFFRASDSILAQARSIGDINCEIEVGCQVAFKTAAVFYKPQKALPLAVQVLELSELNGASPKTYFDALTTTTLCYVRLSQLEEAKNLLTQARSLLNKHPELILFEHRITFFEHYIAEKEGRYEEALELRKQELEMHRTLGNEYGISGSLQNLIATLQRLGQYGAALIWAEELVERVQHQSQAVEPNMLAIHLANLAYLHAALEQPGQGEAVLEPIEAWLKDGGKGFGAVKAWEALGQLYLVKGQYPEAYMAFANTLRLHDNPNYSMSMGWHLYAAYAAFLANLECEARSHVQMILSAADKPKSADSMLLPLIEYLLDKQAVRLEEARFAVLKFVGAIKNPEFRQSALHKIPRHKIVNRYWMQQELEVATVQLSSSHGCKVSTIWTLDSGASDKEHFLASGKVGLRHHRLQRLVLEAAAQGAAPTQSELAQALGVTLQTIETDFATLRKKGIELKTLGMKRETTH